MIRHADLRLAKAKVAGSNPVFRSRLLPGPAAEALTGPLHVSDMPQKAKVIPLRSKLAAFELKVVPRDVQPPIWRRLRVATSPDAA